MACLVPGAYSRHSTFLLFETGSPYVAQADLELTVLLPLES
jgi:hypothetical protein